MQSNLKSALPSTLTGSLREYRVVEGSDLLRRIEGFEAWQYRRFQEGFWPYSRATDAGPRTALSASVTTSAARHRA